MSDRGKIAAFALLVLIAVGVGWGFLHADEQDAKVVQQSACSSDDTVSVASGEKPPHVIKRAVEAIRDAGRLPSLLDVDNYGDAARVLVHQFDDGIVPVATRVSVCATQTHVLSVNGVEVE